MPVELERLVPGLRDWAAARPGIVRLWLYGSRVKVTHRPDSDLDVAFEIDRLADEAAVLTFQATKAQWVTELTALTGLCVHLEPSLLPQVRAGIAECGRLVYERGSSP